MLPHSPGEGCLCGDDIVVENARRRRLRFGRLERARALRESPASGQNAPAEPSGAIERVIATIEAEAARINAEGLSAADAVLTRQGLALDTMFAQLVREAVEEIVPCDEPMRVALRAQSQSRATLTSLISLMTSRSPARPMGAKKIARTN